ncbi:MAG: nitroreductase family protein [Gemmatimonadota bacterium]
MDLFEAIGQRRSIKRFSDREVGRDELARLIGAAIMAPNHRMTQPWRFVLLGPRARVAYARRRGELKARAAAADTVRAAVEEKVIAATLGVPAVVAVLSSVDEDPHVCEEDFAAVWMAIQNLALAATATGLGTHIRTGAVLEDWGVQKIVGAEPGERLCALVYVGEPADTPDPKPRADAASKTTWLD